MDINRVAKRIREKKEIPEVSSNILDPGVEYSFKIDMTMIVDFEGDAVEVPESKIRRKLKSEMLAAARSAALIVANDFGLRAENITVSPVSVTSALNDQTSVGDRGE